MNRILIADDDRATLHLLSGVLKNAGYATEIAKDGLEAQERLLRGRFDVVLLDIWMPRLNGLELLASLRKRKRGPRVVVMTSDDTPDTLLKAIREQAYRYLHKPVDPKQLVETLEQVLLTAAAPGEIEVVSARPEWVELIVPCTRAAAARIEEVMAHLEADLTPEVRESVSSSFRELLLNAVEWGGRLDPSRKVRIAYLRFERMLLYRIADPGPGFDPAKLEHAAVGQPDDDPIAHVQVREKKGIRPGGFGLMMVKAQVDELIYNERRNEVVFVKYLG
ncbi:MAG TPA: response regulator [Candidatus Eisenbacteria bacterium]|nr:response regulator [Candidatus Eisenbacteria bacterium]